MNQIHGDTGLAAAPAVSMRNRLDDGGGSAVSWAAIFAGATAAAALSLILLMLGTGLGLSSVSPWAQSGISATSFGISTILWLTLTQVAAAGMGGYLAGRLRTKWLVVDPDEVHFRDTAHGFLSWAVSTCLTAALLTTTIGAILGNGAQIAASGDGDQVARQDADRARAYYIDTLLRPADDAAAAAPAPAGPTLITNIPSSAESSEQMRKATRIEVAGILANAEGSDALPPDDGAYLARLVARNSGLAESDATARVRDTFSKLRAHERDQETALKVQADKARKASAYGALWLFISLLLGAFCASLAATFGGRQRDL